MKKDYIEKNKSGWNVRTEVHIDSKFYNVPDFKNGENTLHQPELKLLGDINGKSLLHLQCHFGLDTMTLARMGAMCTGVDISSKAIENAIEISKDIGVDVKFIEDDVHNIKKYFSNDFDVVLSSYGVLCWLYDLKIWADGIYSSLKKGGRFYLVEFHPFLDIILNGKVSGHKNYFSNGEPLAEWTEGTYTDSEAKIKYFEYRWQNNISDVINALISSGFKLIDMQEYPYSPYKLSDCMDMEKDGLYSSSSNNYPYLYSLVVEK